MATRGRRADESATSPAPPAPQSAESGATAARPPGDRVLFSGNRHESVPRALFFDTRLTPLERNAWQIFRLHVQNDGVTAFPTYDELSRFLASMPGAKASHETVARALRVLRMTRWISLVRRLRDPKTGCLQGNVYVLHDEPLTPFEAMQLDAEYLGLVGQAMTHATKSVRIVAQHALKEITEDPFLRGQCLPTRMQVLAQHLADQGWNISGCPQAEARDSEEGSGDSLRNRGEPTSESEPGREPAPNLRLRNPKTDSTVRIKGPSIEVPTTVPRARAEPGLRLPDRFTALKKEQQAGAMEALGQVDAAMRQSVLDEWAARCDGKGVRNPAGYLFGIIQKALRGEFKAWAGSAGTTSELTEARAPPPRPPPPSSQPPPTSPSPPPPFPPAEEIRLASPETIQACLTRLKQTLRKK